MKKIASFLLVVCLAMSLSVGCFASGEGSNSSVPAETEPLLVTVIVDGVETEATADALTDKEAVIVYTDGFDGPIASYTSRGADNYRAAIYVDQTGLVDSRSALAAVAKGADIGAHMAENVIIRSTSDDFSGVIVNGGNYEIKDGSFEFLTTSDGHMDEYWRSATISDFAGYGAVIGAFNDAYVCIDNVNIITSGVAKLTLFEDGGSDVVLTNSTICAEGGEIYDGYISTADQNKMVAPPWVLGITGNARTSNMEGTDTSFTVSNVEASAGQWGVLSTDAGTNMQMVVIDSSMTLTNTDDNDPITENWGSGYGTYLIGSNGPAKEYFYGVTFNVGTFACISTGGCAVFASSDFSNGNEMKYSDFLKNAFDPNSTSRVETAGGELVVYAPDGSVNGSDSDLVGIFEGAGNVTTVNSDGFGIMTHSHGGDFVITDGSVFNVRDAIFLLKGGDSSIIVNGQAQLNSENGVLLQMIDNDDTLVGVQMGVEHYSGPTFNTSYEELEGYAGIDYEVTGTPGDSITDITLSDVTVAGDLYNATGYFASTAARRLEVTLGNDAVLDGAISATSTVHVDENGEQISAFTQSEYYYLGRVANKPYYNGCNDVVVTLADNAVWNVTGEGIVTTLTVGENATLNGILTVDGVETAIQPGTYSGEIVIMPAGVADPEAPAVTDGAGEASTGIAQEFALYPVADYEKTFDGYKLWVKTAFASNEHISSLEDKLAAVDAVIEETYDPAAQPFAMQIKFGLICSYEDYLKL